MVENSEAARLRASAAHLPQIVLDAREQADLELIGVGAASPLTGFLGEADFHRVVSEMRLANGLVWPMPLTLSVPPDVAGALNVGTQAALVDGGEQLIGVLDVREIFDRDPLEEARGVYGTDDASHPGVAYTLSRPRHLVAGDVHVLGQRTSAFGPYRLTPAQLREEIARRNWTRVAGFQTRNPMHRAHEFLTKIALEVTDGLVVHPLVGETKDDDIPADVRMRCYEALLASYYPATRVMLAVFPAAMRYAGPREAVFHTLVRKNYGITHLIIGRDHAGVGGFYEPLAAQRIFDALGVAEIGVAPLRLDATFYCRACDGMASDRTCPHHGDARLQLSGSQVRRMLERGEDLPIQFTRPEVARILQEHYGRKPPAVLSSQA